MEEGKAIVHGSAIQKQAGVAKLIFDEEDFKTKLGRRHKEGHYIWVNGTIYQENIKYICLKHW